MKKSILIGLSLVVFLFPMVQAERIVLYDYQDARVVYTGLKEAADYLYIFRNLGGGTWQLSDVMFNLTEVSGYSVTNATVILYNCYLNSNSPYNNNAGTEVFNVSNHTWTPTTAPSSGDSLIAVNNSNYVSPDNITFDVTEQVQREIDAGYGNITFLFRQNTTNSGNRLCDSKQTTDGELPRIIIYGEAPVIPPELPLNNLPTPFNILAAILISAGYILFLIQYFLSAKILNVKSLIALLVISVILAEVLVFLLV